MLTIGQLADYVGVTVRAVRHYHQRGLLAEPGRDASGYRRYDSGAVIHLIRIKALADAGVPLARIGGLLAAGPPEFAGAVAEIDKALAARIRELQAQRHRIAQLVAGDRLFVPAEIADLFDRIRGLGISPQAMQIERLAALADPEFQDLYRAYYETSGWDPDDPRLDEVADLIVNFAERHRADLEQAPAGPPPDDPVAMALVLSRTATAPPAWERLDQLCREKARARGLNVQTTGVS